MGKDASLGKYTHELVYSIFPTNQWIAKVVLIIWLLIDTISFVLILSFEVPMIIIFLL